MPLWDLVVRKGFAFYSNLTLNYANPLLLAASYYLMTLSKEEGKDRRRRRFAKLLYAQIRGPLSLWASSDEEDSPAESDEEEKNRRWIKAICK